MSSTGKEVRSLLRVVKKQPGWVIDHCGRSGSHVRLRSPDGRTTVMVSLQPGSGKAVAAFRSALRRAGVPVD